MYTLYVIANIYELKKKKLNPRGYNVHWHCQYIDCRLLLHRSERETRVTGDERQGTSGYEADIKAPNVPAHPKETLGTKFERKVRTSLCTTTPSPQTKSGRQTSLSQFCSRRGGGRLKAKAEPVILKMKQAFFESYCQKINNGLHTIRNTLIRLYGIDQ